MAFNLRTWRPFADAAIGAKMALRGVISPAAVLRKGRRDPHVARIFEHIRQRSEGKNQ
jgi:hypothetical protein